MPVTIATALPPRAGQHPLVRWLFLLVALLAGCDYQHRLRPASPLATRGKQVRAQIEWVSPHWKGDAPTHVAVRVRNHGPGALHFNPGRAGLAELHEGRSPEPAASRPVSSPRPEVRLGSPVGGAVAGAKIGSGLSGPGGSGLGGLAGAGIGLAAGVAVMLPVGIVLAIDRAVAEARRHLEPGEEAVFPLAIKDVSLVDGRRYGLVLHAALQQRPQDLPPLPIVLPEQEHFGYDAPDDLRWILVARVGGGPLLGKTDAERGAMGGVGLFFGPQFHRFSVGIGGTLLGAGALGTELRYDIPAARWLSLVPFAGYGYYWLVGGPGLNVGHGPWAGLELNFPLGATRLFGWDVRDYHLGLYAQGGPVFLFEGQSPAWQVQGGVSFGIY
jgi:hypothetical protein